MANSKSVSGIYLFGQLAQGETRDPHCRYFPLPNICFARADDNTAVTIKAMTVRVNKLKPQPKHRCYLVMRWEKLPPLPPLNQVNLVKTYHCKVTLHWPPILKQATPGCYFSRLIWRRCIY